MKLAFILCAGMALAQQPGQVEGQQQESLKGVVKLNRAPVSKEVLRVNLPKPVERKLRNGLRVVIVEDHRLPTVAMQMVLPASALRDPADLPGLASATASSLRYGAGKRSSREIAESLTEMGATLNVTANYGARSTVLGASALTESLDAVRALVADVLLRPSFPQEELDKAQKRILTQLQQARGSEQFLTEELLHKVLYAGDGRAIVAPTPDAIRKITREHMVAFHAANYKPAGALLGITGDVKPAEMIAKLEKAFEGWTGGPVEEAKAAARTPIGEKRVYLVNRPNSVQTRLTLANHAVDRAHPDYFALQVMNRILGGGPSGRLFMNLREAKGYTYGASSSIANEDFRHHFSAAASVRTEVTEAALEEFLKEFRAIRDQVVGTEDLENAKRALVANFALSLENRPAVLSRLLSLREKNLPLDYWDTYAARVMAVTAADVQRVAKRYVPVDNLQLFAVGDATKIRAVLAKFGVVEEYNADGARQ
ncbi:MAG: insulinase family protein [Bryobacterales bacterium]|nr:insulinase family protein [Bryobacterales bacterium]